MSYTVKFLEWDEFDKLADKNPRYKNIKDSIGFADREKGIAYARKTGSVLADGLTAVHELEHLVNADDIHTDEYGIAHKKFYKDILHPILKVASYAAAPATSGWSLLYGPVADTGIATQEGQKGVGRTFLRSYANMLGTTAGGLLGGASGAALGSYGTTRLTGGTNRQAINNAMIGSSGVALSGGGYQGASTTSPNPNYTGNQSGAGPTSPNPRAYGAQFSGGGAGNVYTPTGNIGTDIIGSINAMINKGIQSLTSFGKNVLGLGGTAGTAGGAGAAQQASRFGYGGFGNLGPILAGSGLLAAASQIKSPEPPSYEDFISPVQSALTQQLLGGQVRSPVAQAATGELQRIISSPFGEAFGGPQQDPYVTEAKRQNEINYRGDQTTGRTGQRDAIVARYNAMGHYEGRSGTLDATLERADQEFLRGQNQLDQEAQFRAQETEKASRFQALQMALGLEQNQMADLIQLANIDISIAALKYGIEVEDARAIRDMFGRAGGLAIGAGILGA